MLWQLFIGSNQAFRKPLLNGGSIKNFIHEKACNWIGFNHFILYV